MRLVVHELYAQGLKQRIKVTENLNIVSIRPHLYKHLSPAGSFKLELLDENEQKIDESETLTMASVSSANYFHGYVRVNCTFALKKNTEYYIKLVGSGYTFNESAWFGWCNDYDLRKVEASYTRNQGYYGALDMELWDSKLRSWED